MVRSLQFKRRSVCECCGSADIEIIREVKFADEFVFNFIDRYYAGALSRDALERNLFNIATCRLCGFLFQTYVLDDDGMARLYEEIIDSGESLNKRENAPADYFYGLIRSALVVQTLFPISRRPRSIEVLDFGMGWGHWALAAKACGYSVTGHELSPKRVDFAFRHGVNVVSDLDGFAEHFDFINTDQVLEHVPDAYDMGVKLVRALKRGGVLKIFVPNGNRMRGVVESPDWEVSKGPLQPLEHVNCFGWKAILAFARRLGLRPASAADFFTFRKKLLAVAQLQLFRRPSWYFIKTES